MLCIINPAWWHFLSISSFLANFVIKTRFIQLLVNVERVGKKNSCYWLQIYWEEGLSGNFVVLLVQLFSQLLQRIPGSKVLEAYRVHLNSNLLFFSWIHTQKHCFSSEFIFHFSKPLKVACFIYDKYQYNKNKLAPSGNTSYVIAICLCHSLSSVSLARGYFQEGVV